MNYPHKIIYLRNWCEVGKLNQVSMTCFSSYWLQSYQAEEFYDITRMRLLGICRQFFISLRDLKMSSDKMARTSSLRPPKKSAHPNTTKRQKAKATRHQTSAFNVWCPAPVQMPREEPMEVDVPMEDDFMDWSPSIPTAIQSTPPFSPLLQPSQFIFRPDDEPELVEVDEPVEDDFMKWSPLVPTVPTSFPARPIFRQPQFVFKSLSSPALLSNK